MTLAGQRVVCSGPLTDLSRLKNVDIIVLCISVPCSQ